MRAWLWAVALGCVSCSADDGGAPAKPASDAGETDGATEAPPDGTFGPHPTQLPFSYTRTDQGTPVDPSELASVTDEYLDLMTQIRYFALLDERVHGSPESSGGYWYGTWWSGADVYKSGSSVTYHHNEVGGDNNGLRTAPLFEGACYASLLWNDPLEVKLTRRLLRGFSSWALAMVKPGGEPVGALLTRAAYLENFTDTDRGISVDYSLNRPGVDNGATEYIHIPDNPTFGDVWVKNKRSKDDLGHMLRAICQTDSCAGSLGSEADADFTELRKLYVTFARRVEDDEWKIATYDKSLTLWYPPGSLANFSLLGNAECTAVLSLRLVGRASPREDIDCGNGIGVLDQAIMNANDQNGEILRTFHEAAANAALIANQPELAKTLLEGLAARMDKDLDAFESGSPPKYTSEENLVDLIVHSANAGVPLTSREVRFVHQALVKAKAKLLAPENAASIDVKSPSVPDGSYLFEPASDGVNFKTLGALLGSCAAQYRNPDSRPLLDCAKVKAHGPT